MFFLLNNKWLWFWIWLLETPSMKVNYSGEIDLVNESCLLLQDRVRCLDCGSEFRIHYYLQYKENWVMTFLKGEHCSTIRGPGSIQVKYCIQSFLQMSDSYTITHTVESVLHTTSAIVTVMHSLQLSECCHASSCKNSFNWEDFG